MNKPKPSTSRVREFREAQQSLGRSRVEYYLTPAERMLLDKYLETLRSATKEKRS